MSDIIRIGSRGSALALWQANFVKSEIEKANQGMTAEITVIKTTGDKILDVPLAQVGGKGLFVKEIEEALLSDRVDLAVHSMKDVPTDLPEPLTLYAITEREDPRDALICKSGKKVADMGEGSSIGTSSLRRQSQLLHKRPDLVIKQLRGNLDTRINKALAGEYDGIIVAAAGVRRMGWAEKITEYFETSFMLPAIGQGALGIELRKNDSRTKKIADLFNHRDTSVAVRGERAFLKRLEGGCQVPIAAYGTVEGDTVTLSGFVSDVDGKRTVQEKGSDHIDNTEKLGTRLAETLLSRGADVILKEVYETM